MIDLVRLNFELPGFCRVTWASDSARAAWEPQLEVARQALNDARWAHLAKDGAHAAAFLVSPRAAFGAIRRAAELRLSCEVLPVDQIAWPPRKAHARDAQEVVAVVTAATNADELRDALQRANVERALLLMGWPACCAARHVAAGTWLDCTWVTIRGTPDWTMGEGEAWSRGASWQTNPFLRSLGLSALDHAPCGLTCTRSVERAEARFDALSEAEGPERVDLLRRILSWPVQWSGLHGIAETKTPVCKVSSRTDAIAHRLTVRLQGDVPLPAESPAGVMFPYRRSKQLPVVQSKSFLRGVAAVSSAKTPARCSPAPVAPPVIDLGRLERLPSHPLVVTGMTDSWPAREWTLSWLRERFGHVEVDLRPHYQSRDHVRMKLGEYLDALDSAVGSNLYLTDWGFEHVDPALLESYTVPEVFRSWHMDLPATRRPGLRSLYLGGKGTGTPPHVDVMMTGAWNALLVGRKAWWFARPEVDEGTIARILDLRELGSADVWGHVQEPGEVIFTPSGWWHQVENLATSLALTENFVNASNYRDVEACTWDHEYDDLRAIGRELRAAIALHVPRSSEEARRADRSQGERIL